MNMGVSKNNGTSKWMVKTMENPMNKWMIWGKTPYFWFNTHISRCLFKGKQVGFLTQVTDLGYVGSRMFDSELDTCYWENLATSSLL